MKVLEDCYESKDQSLFWKKIGKVGLSSERKHFIPWEVTNRNGEILTDKDSVLNKWQNDFTSIYQNENTNETLYDDEHLVNITREVSGGNIVPINENHNAEVLNVPVSIDEVKNAVLRAKAGKAKGFDDIPAEVLKNDCCINMLHRIITSAFNLGIVPGDWNKGIIHPIPKSASNDPRNPLNYRGITLISIPCKIYCSVLNNRLSKWMEEHSILVDEQNGFRRNRSCLDHLYVLHNVINYQKSNKKSAYVCFVDAKKAFDSVDRICLWYKLQRIGLQGKMLKAIQSLYNNVECAVRLNGMLSNWFKVPNGVKQGCLLSPALFAIFVNDLACEIKDLQCGINLGDNQISILMFADDIALLSDSEDKMQTMLDCLFTWCSKWRLSLNLDKTKLVHFRHQSIPRTIYDFKYGEGHIDITTKYKYLGLWLSEHLVLKDTVQPLTASAGRALGALMSKFKRCGGFNFDIYTKLYSSLVDPILNYGAGLWGTSEYKIANTIQHRACRFFLGVGSNTSNLATRGEMGWQKQCHKQYIEVTRLYCRLQLLPNERQTNQIHQFSQHHGGNSTWEKKAKALFNRIGLVIPDREFSQARVLNDMKQLLVDVDQEQWWYDMLDDKNCPNGNKLRTYRMHKNRLNTEEYVKLVSRYNRSTLAKLRCGSLPLNIETGRYNKVPLELRTCILCDANKIEDEIHFTIECKFYDDLRYAMLNEFNVKYNGFNQLPSLAKYCTIMADMSFIKLVANSVNKMFKRRQTYC